MKTRIATFKDFVGELTVTYRRTSLPSKKVSCSKDAVDFMRPYYDITMDDREEAKILHINRANGVVNVTHLTRGSDSGTMVPIKEILKEAILIKTCSIILFHNHPSGNLKPSEQDLDMSKKLKKACDLIEVPLLDSIIITRESYCSLADEGFL